MKEIIASTPLFKSAVQNLWMCQSISKAWLLSWILFYKADKAVKL